MSTDEATPVEMVTLTSIRFGDISVPKETLIEFPSGMIGFPNDKQFFVLEHKPPFSWLHSMNNPALAFVIIEAAEFGDQYKVKTPYGDRDTDLKEGDEFVMLVVVTVRSDPTMTTVNLKAPIFVNLRNRKGVQLILDDSRYSTRFPLYQAEEPEKK